MIITTQVDRIRGIGYSTNSIANPQVIFDLGAFLYLKFILSAFGTMFLRPANRL